MVNMTSNNEKTMLLARNIAKYRKIKKLSQTKFALQLEISREHVAKIETGLRQPSLSLIFKIAQTLDIKEKDLFDFEN